MEPRVEGKPGMSARTFQILSSEVIELAFEEFPTLWLVHSLSPAPGTIGRT